MKQECLALTVITNDKYDFKGCDYTIARTSKINSKNVIKLEALARKIINYEEYSYRKYEYEYSRTICELVKLSELKYQMVDLNKYKAYPYKKPSVSNELANMADTLEYYREAILDAIVNKDELELECRFGTNNSLAKYKFIPISEIKDDIISAIEERVELELVYKWMHNNPFNMDLLKAKSIDLNDPLKSNDILEVYKGISNYENSNNITLITVSAKKNWVSSDNVICDNNSSLYTHINEACYNSYDIIEKPLSDVSPIRLDRYPKSLLLYNPNSLDHYYPCRYQRKFSHRIQLVLGGFKILEKKVIEI